jgi:hypothetical protein
MNFMLKPCILKKSTKGSSSTPIDAQIGLDIEEEPKDGGVSGSYADFDDDYMEDY